MNIRRSTIQRDKFLFVMTDGDYESSILFEEIQVSFQSIHLCVNRMSVHTIDCMTRSSVHDAIREAEEVGVTVSAKVFITPAKEGAPADEQLEDAA